MKLPEKVPQEGFYYHYKHDPNGSVNNYAYEFLSVGFDTESDKHFANYRPLYPEANVYQAYLKFGVLCVDNRYLEMWMGDVTKEGKTFPRFSKITDPTVIAQLEEIKKTMYRS